MQQLKIPGSKDHTRVAVFAVSSISYSTARLEAGE